MSTIEFRHNILTTKKSGWFFNKFWKFKYLGGGSLETASHRAMPPTSIPSLRKHKSHPSASGTHVLATEQVCRRKYSLLLLFFGRELWSWLWVGPRPIKSEQRRSLFGRIVSSHDKFGLLPPVLGTSRNRQEWWNGLRWWWGVWYFCCCCCKGDFAVLPKNFESSLEKECHEEKM